MDTQLGVGPELDNEWAVDKIISHAGSGLDAEFEVLWKAGDVTWLPYYQIEHLQALDAYLDLLGVEFIGKLPSGKGKPPRNDAQVFLGAIGMKKILSSKFKFLSFHINIDLLFNSFSSLFPCIPSKILINNQPIINHHSFPINNNCHIDTIMPLPGVWHLNFKCISKTHYLITNFGNQNQHVIIHIGQIYQYIAFNNYIHTNENKLCGYAGVPVRFCDFVLLYSCGQLK